MAIHSIMGIVDVVGDDECDTYSDNKAFEIVDFYYTIKSLLLVQSALTETDEDGGGAEFYGGCRENELVSPKTAPIPIPRTDTSEAAKKIERKRI